MKLLTYNVRGLWGRAKWKEIREVIAREELDMICIQESKMEVNLDKVCGAIWGDSGVVWKHVSTINQGGSSVWMCGGEGFLVIGLKGGGMGSFFFLQDHWLGDPDVLNIVNVYLSCALVDKKNSLGTTSESKKKHW